MLVSQSGFGLLTSKKQQWFTDAGAKVGEVTTRDLIRAIHATEGGAVVQTRQHQVEVYVGSQSESTRDHFSPENRPFELTTCPHS